jgi:hypothetical protein
LFFLRSTLIVTCPSLVSSTAFVTTPPASIFDWAGELTRAAPQAPSKLEESFPAMDRGVHRAAGVGVARLTCERYPAPAQRTGWNVLEGEVRRVQGLGRQ